MLLYLRLYFVFLYCCSYRKLVVYTNVTIILNSITLIRFYKMNNLFFIPIVIVFSDDLFSQFWYFWWQTGWFHFAFYIRLFLFSSDVHARALLPSTSAYQRRSSLPLLADCSSDSTLYRSLQRQWICNNLNDRSPLICYTDKHILLTKKISFRFMIYILYIIFN